MTIGKMRAERNVISSLCRENNRCLKICTGGINGSVDEVNLDICVGLSVYGCCASLWAKGNWNYLKRA